MTSLENVDQETLRLLGRELPFFFLSTDELMAMNKAVISLYGGLGFGVREQGLLESAAHRPLHLASYDERDIHVIAASLAHGICQNHPFFDGNKRTAFAAMSGFLNKNGLELVASSSDNAVQIYGLAAGKVTEAEFAVWLSTKTKPRPDELNVGDVEEWKKARNPKISN